ncbi:hypothetical protein TNCT_7991 [Trichonephila clavata]|uniref:Uncharacterized protein n=1 Tax=Trichonephila clavata TaxID=2740835 RepID=A0A8X6GSW5_TRICU|nr:hypothetical protein TNCT_7991 [Trichonephila clavata]
MGIRCGDYSLRYPSRIVVYHQPLSAPFAQTVFSRNDNLGFLRHPCDSIYDLGQLAFLCLSRQSKSHFPRLTPGPERSTDPNGSNELSRIRSLTEAIYLLKVSSRFWGRSFCEHSWGKNK